jgi:carbamoyl-phosphate synthase small subunit
MQHEILPAPPYANAVIVLADGTYKYGRGVGFQQSTVGELCFNTSMTGYQEVLTDPSYAGQLITFTFPHIGNVGTNKEDIEARKAYAAGLILREPVTYASNYRSESHFANWLEENELTGIYGVDTRGLTRHIRHHGPQNAVIYYGKEGDDFDIPGLIEQARAHPSLKGMELAKAASHGSRYSWDETRWRHGESFGKSDGSGPHIVAIDYGEKLNILRCLADHQCKVTVMPGTASADDIMKLSPDGVFLSNGPGDPAATAEYAVPVIQALMDADIPIFGICLGHQLLALACGAATEKMQQGHRGANHPVKNLQNGQVEITSQNHGFVVSHGSLPEAVETTHISLFDGTIEGLRHKHKPVFSVQYHPESSPGPHDSMYLFEDFLTMIAQHQSQQAA